METGLKIFLSEVFGTVTLLRSTARQCLIVLAEKSLLSEYPKNANMKQNNWQDLFSDSWIYIYSEAECIFWDRYSKAKVFVAVGFCFIFLPLFWMTIWYSSLFFKNKISHPTESEDAVNENSRIYYCGLFFFFPHLVYGYCLSVSMTNSIVFKSVEQTKTTVIFFLFFFFNHPVFNYRTKQSQDNGRVFLVIFVYKLCLVTEFFDFSFFFLYDWSL